MNGTPRLRSAYPTTPRTGRQDGRREEASHSTPLSKPAASPASTSRSEEVSKPLVPLSILDAPTQRLYVSAFYLGLLAWRFYDYYSVVSSEADSWGLFLKWVFFDAVFLFGLPELRIPWMEWSTATMAVLYIFHVAASGILMFRIPVSPSLLLSAFLY